MNDAGSCVLSPCEKYRFYLGRWWADGLNCLFIMLNPSTADDSTDDPTIVRIIDFARRWGCGSVSVVNMFALRATSPSVMKAHSDPIGPDNNYWIERCLRAADGPIVVAWGNHGTHMDRDLEVAELIVGYDVKCLGITKQGQPRHPLYLPKDAPLQPFNHKAALMGAVR